MEEQGNATLWLEAHSGPLGIEVSARSQTVRITDATGVVFTARGFEASVELFEVVGSRKLWAADAALQEREHRSFLLALGWPRIYCATTVDRAIAPQKKKDLLAAGPGTAPLMRAHSAAAPIARRHAREIEAEDHLWRRATRRGFLIDQVALPEERQSRHRDLAEFARTHGVDIRRSEASKIPFLKSIGVKFAVTEGYGWSLPGELDISDVAEENMPTWLAYKAQHSVLKRVQILDGLAKTLHTDGRVRPLVRTNQAATGRMALQNPGLMSLMKELRGVVLAEPGYTILEVDHSSAEILVLARLIGSPSFTLKVLSGDPYQQLADATGLERWFVKPKLLAFVYDQTIKGLARQVGMETAELIHTAIRGIFPEIVAWRDEQTAAARRLRSGERLTTLWGRPLPVLDGLSYETRPGLAANARVQGSARDAFGHAVRAADALGLTLFFPLHDAIFILAPQGTAETTGRRLIEAMTVDLDEGVVLTGKAKNHGGRWGA